MKSHTYTVIYEHDGSMWFARIVEIEGCHTQGRTLAQARERIREALSLFDEKAETATLVDDVKLPRAVLAKLRQLEADRAKAEEFARKVRARSLELARALTKDVGVSLGDAGALLGVSKQRVQQILEEKAS